MPRRLTVILAVITTVFGTLAATALSENGNAPSQSQDVIKIGLVVSTKGPLLPWGKDALDGAYLAVAQANENGGINGKKVVLEHGESFSLPEQARDATTELISRGVVAVIGDISSGLTVPMSQVTCERKLPHVIIAATKPGLTDAGENVFRVCYTDDFQGRALAKFAFDKLRLQRVAILTDQRQPYAKQLTAEFISYFRSIGGQIVASVEYESYQTSFTAQLMEVVEAAPQGVFVSGYFTEAGPIVRQAAQAGLGNAKFFGGDGWDSTELISSGGEAILGSYFANHYSPGEPRATVGKFHKEFEARYGHAPVTTMAALSYDATNVLIDAIRRAGSTESDAINKALAGTESFPGVTGQIDFKGHGREANKRIVFVEVTKDGFKYFATLSHEEVDGKGN